MIALVWRKIVASAWEADSPGSRLVSLGFSSLAILLCSFRKSVCSEARVGWIITRTSPATRSVELNPPGWYKGDWKPHCLLVGRLVSSNFELTFNNPSWNFLNLLAVWLSEPYIWDPSMKAVFPLNCSRGTPGEHLTSDLVKGRQAAELGISFSGTGMFRHRLDKAGLAWSRARNFELQQSSSGALKWVECT